MSDKKDLNFTKAVLKSQGGSQSLLAVQMGLYCNTINGWCNTESTLSDGFGAGSGAAGSRTGGLNRGWHKKRKRPDG